MAYPHVFAPLTLRRKTLRNRVVFGAHTANMARGGLPGPQHVAYYRERALGGAAIGAGAAAITSGSLARGAAIGAAGNVAYCQVYPGKCN